MSRMGKAVEGGSPAKGDGFSTPESTPKKPRGRPSKKRKLEEANLKDEDASEDADLEERVEIVVKDDDEQLLAKADVKDEIEDAVKMENIEESVDLDSVSPAGFDYYPLGLEEI